jgi:hypothetical protein
MKEHLEAVETGKQLAPVRDLLVSHHPDDKPMEAIADKETWMLSKPGSDGQEY